MDMEDPNFNVYVGTDSGVLKGIYFGSETPRSKNFNTFAQINDRHKIVSMSWLDETQKEIMVTFNKPVIKIYNTKLRAFSTCIKFDDLNGELVGVYPFNASYLIGLECGEVILWNFAEGTREIELNAGKELSVLKPCIHQKSILATGGKESDLKIWNLEASNPSIPIFSAKNVPHDFLDLRVPVWVQDLAFLPQSNDLVAVCTRFGQVRLYDPKVNNKCRPVINMEYMDHPLMAISTTLNNRQVLVGSSQGKMGLLDLRTGNKGRVVRHFGGFSGSIRSISAHPESPYFVSCGLDRHLYLHNLNEKKPLKKLYLKSRLNSVLMTDSFPKDFDPLWDNSTVSKDEPVHWENINMDSLLTSSIPVVPPTSSIATGSIHTSSPKKRKLRL